MRSFKEHLIEAARNIVKNYTEGEQKPDTAESLVAEVFELWDTFHKSDDPRLPCPGCDGPPSMTGNPNARHLDYCWFGRAEKWLLNQGKSIPKIQ